MTGFARADGARAGQSWTWEVKSVNGRGLEVRFRLPPGLDAIELPARVLVGERLKRGSVTVALRLDSGPSVTGYRLNQALLKQLGDIVREAEGVVESAPPRLDGLLALRGVLEPEEVRFDEAERAQQEAAMLVDLANALDRLREGRGAEGARITTMLNALLDDIVALIAAAEDTAAVRLDSRQARLTQGLAELLEQRPPLSEDRLAQELALLAVKADVREEIDRLKAHVAQARELIAKGDANGAGRRLDFLAQEFNREANTLCSKSGDVALTRIGLDLKLAIDRLREQVQNVE